MLIIALEPDAENYSLAQMNLSPYGERVKLLNAAVGIGQGPSECFRIDGRIY